VGAEQLFADQLLDITVQVLREDNCGTCCYCYVLPTTCNYCI